MRMQERTPLLEINEEESEDEIGEMNDDSIHLNGIDISDRRSTFSRGFLNHFSQKIFPGALEDDNDLTLRASGRSRDSSSTSSLLSSRITKPHYSTRNFRRQLFLLLTEPNTSFLSVIFFGILIIAIALSNLIMIMQTMKPWQFIPTDCVSCGGTVAYMYDDDDTSYLNQDQLCICPPAPIPLLVYLEDTLIWFFSIEWVLRVLFFEPAPADRAHTLKGFISQWLGYLIEPTTVLDFLAIFPYFMERFGSNSRGLLSLRLLRLFRVFQLVRLGQFNSTFMSLTNVLTKSLLYLRLLLVVLIFGAAFFGSMMYWLEKGSWQYWEETGDFQFIRKSENGVDQEISPFVDIPHAFWWFMVTATTLGYGDLYPTSQGGKFVAILAMLTGVLVIAFPVSVFSDLWSKEIMGSQQESDKPRESEGESVTMSSNDVQELRKLISELETNQQKVNDILAKYDLSTN